MPPTGAFKVSCDILDPSLNGSAAFAEGSEAEIAGSTAEGIVNPACPTTSGTALVTAAGTALATPSAATAWGSKPAAPELIKDSPKPAPPYAPRPAIKPFFKSPVASAVPPPISKAAAGAPIPVAAKAIPPSIGKIEDKNPASGNPV